MDYLHTCIQSNLGRDILVVKIRFKRKPKLKTREYYESQGCSIHRLSIFSTRFYAFIEDFKVGDDVYWFGHDNVYAFMNSQKYTATQDMVDRIGNNVGPFLRMVGECRQ